MDVGRQDLEAERRKWRQVPRRRPPSVVVPGPGQESVWSYPRPPRMEPVAGRVRVEWRGVLLADSTRAFRVVETSSPPVYYIPPGDVRVQDLSPSEGTTVCEWKGVARYWDLRRGSQVVRRVAWSYPEPDEPYIGLKDYLAFYAGKMDACWIGSQRVTAQAGDFYGGWITPDIVGPFKGEPGTELW